MKSTKSVSIWTTSIGIILASISLLGIFGSTGFQWSYGKSTFVFQSPVVAGDESCFLHMSAGLAQFQIQVVGCDIVINTHNLQIFNVDKTETLFYAGTLCREGASHSEVNFCDRCMLSGLVSVCSIVLGVMFGFGGLHYLATTDNAEGRNDDRSTLERGRLFRLLTLFLFFCSWASWMSYANVALLDVMKSNFSSERVGLAFKLQTPTQIETLSTGALLALAATVIIGFGLMVEAVATLDFGLGLGLGLGSGSGLDLGFGLRLVYLISLPLISAFFFSLRLSRLK
uniref:Uncharacterized protein n=1 Tax=Amorphochlora amoebiformis TaxID=1561963 RepID=A0A6T6Y902_9EUKA|mmetsp:Transcript_5463/g.8313  ORF Transcript_5463/g.8313 Transcript_5463/m.8313 type:complete len:285 (+) Transcript_5463:298-1152(+)